jgi:hypothetical protein
MSSLRTRRWSVPNRTTGSAPRVDEAPYRPSRETQSACCFEHR